MCMSTRNCYTLSEASETSSWMNTSFLLPQSICLSRAVLKWPQLTKAVNCILSLGKEGQENQSIVHIHLLSVLDFLTSTTLVVYSPCCLLSNLIFTDHSFHKQSQVNRIKAQKEEAQSEWLLFSWGPRKKTTLLSLFLYQDTCTCPHTTVMKTLNLPELVLSFNFYCSNV